jgi:hypothetical protein
MILNHTYEAESPIRASIGALSDLLHPALSIQSMRRAAFAIPMAGEVGILGTRYVRRVQTESPLMAT